MFCESLIEQQSFKSGYKNRESQTRTVRGSELQTDAAANGKAHNN